MPESRLDAVFFDVDDTLYSSSGFAELARERAIQAMSEAGVRADPERLKALLGEIIGEYSSNFPYQFDELVARLPPESYRPLNPAVVVAAAVIAYHDTKSRELRPYPDVRGVLGRLKAAGLPMGVVTAGVPVKQAEKLLRLGLLDLFEPGWVFIADQLEITKEEPRLWLDVARRTGIAPERAAYVGDHPVKDVIGPDEVGMVTVLLRRGGKYADLECRTRPRHEARDLEELERVLLEDYGVPGAAS